MVETLLGALTERFSVAGRGAEGEAVRALHRAVNSHQWATAAYLSDYLADTFPKRPAKATGGGAAPFSNPATEHIEQEVLRCLRENVDTTRRDRPGEPFQMTDAIEDECVGRGIDFAISVAIVDCAARGVAPPDRLECARRAVSFRHADPDLPPEVYGGAENPCECFSLANPGHSGAHLLGPGDAVVPAGPIDIQVAEPRELAGVYKITTDGTRAGLARAIAVKYRELYDAAAARGVGPARDLSELDLREVERLPGGGLAVRTE